MREFLRKVARILRASAAAVTTVALMPIRLASGAMSWVWQAVTTQGSAAQVETVDELQEIVDDLRQPDKDPAERALEMMGAEVRVAARQMLEQGRVTSPDVWQTVKSYVESLERGDLVAIMRASDEKVGRHIAGLEMIIDDVGVPVARPNPVEDVKKAERKRNEVAARKHAYAAERERQLDREAPQPSFGSLSLSM